MRPVTVRLTMAETIDFLKKCGARASDPDKAEFIRQCAKADARVAAARARREEPTQSPQVRHAIERLKPKDRDLDRYIGKPCPYCGDAMTRSGGKRASRDHKLPRSKGGVLNAKNKIIVCQDCNGDKGSLTLQQFADWLTARRDDRAGLVWNLLARGG